MQRYHQLLLHHIIMSNYVFKVTHYYTVVVSIIICLLVTYYARVSVPVAVVSNELNEVTHQQCLLKLLSD